MITFLSYSYKTCGKFHIKAQVRNHLTEGDWETFLHPQSNGDADVDVFCEFEPKALIINTFPVKQAEGINLFIAKSRPLLLSVFAKVGSFLKFEIHWGDGFFDTVDQSGKLVSVKFDSSHLFNDTGTYDVRLKIYSPATTHDILIGKVDVLKCGPSFVIYDFGSKEDPVLIPISHSKMVTGVWIIDDQCADQVEPNFVPSTWSLKYRHNGSLIKAWHPNLGMQKRITTHLLKKGNLPLGSYQIELTMNWNGDVPHNETYFGFFDVTLSKLSIQIVNGIEATIPFQTRSATTGVNASFFEFDLDARISFDPNDEQAGLRGMQFKWACRRLSTEAQYLELLEHRLESHQQQETAAENPATPSANARKKVVEKILICREERWQEMDSHHGPLLNLHTKNLLEGLSYLFRVTVVKGGMQGKALQQLNVLAGATPRVKIT